MGQVADILNAPEWDSKTPLEKSAARKDLFQLSVAENPQLASALSGADDAGKQQVFDAWDKELRSRFHDKFTTEGSYFLSHKGGGTEGLLYPTKTDVPISDTHTEQILAEANPTTEAGRAQLAQVREQLKDNPAGLKSLRVLLAQRYGATGDTDPIPEENIYHQKVRSREIDNPLDPYNYPHLIPGAIRTVGNLGGRALAGAAAIETGPGALVAQAAGGLAGSAVAEPIARSVEEKLSGKAPTLGQSALNIAMGGIPNLPGVKGPVANALIRTGEGAALNAGYTALDQALGDGPMNAKEIGLAGAVGGGIGALLHVAGPAVSDKMKALYARLSGKAIGPATAEIEAVAAQGLNAEEKDQVAKLQLAVKAMEGAPAPNAAGAIEATTGAGAVPPTAEQSLARQAGATDAFAQLPPKSAAESMGAVVQNQDAALTAERAQAEIAAHNAANPELPAMSRQAQSMYDQYGYVNPTLLGSVAGGGVGAAYGSTQGDTLEERVGNAALYGMAGLAGGAALGRGLMGRLSGRPVAEQIPILEEAMAKADSPELKAQLADTVKTLTEREALTVKYPELRNIPEGQVPVEIKGVDGKVYPAIVNGYYDLPDGARASVGRLSEAGWSHGLLRPGETIVTKIPDAEQWAKGVREIGRPLPENTQVTVMEMGGKRALQLETPGPEGQRPIFSGSPKDAEKVGFDVSSIADDLPPGKYTLGGLRQAAALKSTSGAIDPVLARALASGGGGVAGFVAGVEQDPNASTEDRLKNGLMMGLAGAGAGYMLGHAFVGRPGNLGAVSPLTEDRLASWRRRLTPLEDGTPVLDKIADLPNAVRERFTTRFAPLDKIPAQLEKANPGLSILKPYLPLSQQFDNVAGMFGKGMQAVQDAHEAVFAKLKPEETEAFNILLAEKRTGQRLQEDAKFQTEKARISQIPQDQWSPQEQKIMARPDDLKRVAKDSLADVDRGLAQLRTRLGQSRFDELDQLAGGALQQEFDKALHVKVAGGLISPEQYAGIKTSNDFYTPFRVQQAADEWALRGGANSRQVSDTMVRAIEGIDSLDFRLSKTPIEASVDNIFNSQLLAEKNRKMMELGKYAAVDNSGTVLKKLQDWEEPARGMEVVHYFDNGQPVRMAVNPDVAQAIKGLNPGEAGFITQVAMKLNAPYRVGATGKNLAFQTANAPWDFARLAAMSDYGARPSLKASEGFGLRLFLDHAQSIFDAMRGQRAFSASGGVAGFLGGYATAPADDSTGQKLERGAAGAALGAGAGLVANRLATTPQVYKDFYNSGAAFSTVQDFLDLAAGKYKPESIAASVTAPARSVLGSIEALGKVIEESTKLTSFRRGVRMEDLGNLSGQAKYERLQNIVAETRNFGGSPDFLRGGTWAKELNPVLVFFNPRIQGAAKDIGRLLGGDGAKAATEAWTRLAPITLAGVGLWYLNHRPENQADYARRSDVEKEHYVGIPRYDDQGKPLYFKNEKGEQVREYWNIPLRDTGKLLYNLSEHAMDFAYDKDPNAVRNAAVQFGEDISPINISGRTGRERIESATSSFGPLATIPYTLASGRDAFRHRDVVPEIAGGAHDNMQKADPTQQYLPNTPEAFKKLANVMPQQLFDPLRSPLYLQTLTSEAVGGAVSQFMPPQPLEGRDPLANRLSQNPVTKRFIGSNYVQPNKQDAALLQKTQQDGATQNVENWRQVQDIVKKLPTMTPQEKQATLQQLQADPRLKKSVVRALMRGSLELDATESQVLSANTGERAAFLYEKIMGLPQTERGTYLAQPWVAKALTTEVKREMAQLVLADQQPAN